VSAAVITASASILVAVLAFVFNQQAQLEQERRQARLARVNLQLRELYGPLNALVDVNERLWAALHESHLPPQAERRPERAAEDWRVWRDNALMPVNLKMRDLIIDHADLLVESEVPQPLRDFCAHVSSLEIILAAEARGVKEEDVLIRHPGTPYVSYVQGTYLSLKAGQQLLLRSHVTLASRISRTSDKT
jgi:hypothetical protein